MGKRKTEQEVFDKIFEDTGCYPSFSFLQDRKTGYLGVIAYAGKYAGFSIISPKDMGGRWDAECGEVVWNEEKQVGACKAVAGYVPFTDKDTRQCALGRLQLAIDCGQNGKKKRPGWNVVRGVSVQGIRDNSRYSIAVAEMRARIEAVLDCYGTLIIPHKAKGV